jgi:putative SOS response-associated peptidase YedK
MCNLYRLDQNQDELRHFFKVTRDRTGNQPPLSKILPDTTAPVVRQVGGERVMEMKRWGMPTPPNFLREGAIDTGVTNIRNVTLPHWKRWLTPGYRCLVPATSFCEPMDKPSPETGKKRWAWFALSHELPLFAFAGIWCSWRGVRGTRKEPLRSEHQLYAFLTTAANDAVKPIHSKAMPALLGTPDEQDAWLTAPIEDALRLQRPFPASGMRVVAIVEKPNDPWTPA